jgi:hypothetical protein
MLTAVRSGDEIESGAALGGSGEDGSWHSASDPASVFSGGEGQDRDCALRRSLRELARKIDAYVAHHNTHKRPFAWNALADSILDNFNAFVSY